MFTYTIDKLQGASYIIYAQLTRVCRYNHSLFKIDLFKLVCIRGHKERLFGKCLTCTEGKLIKLFNFCLIAKSENTCLKLTGFLIKNNR